MREGINAVSDASTAGHGSVVARAPLDVVTLVPFLGSGRVGTHGQDCRPVPTTPGTPSPARETGYGTRASETFLVPDLHSIPLPSRPGSAGESTPLRPTYRPVGWHGRPGDLSWGYTD